VGANQLVGFGTLAALSEERISNKRRILSGDQGMIVWWSIGAGVHVEPHSHANEKMEFRLGNEQRVCGPGDVVVFTSTPLIFLGGPPLGARRQLLCAPAFPSK
jgi:hypothetical protein